MTGQHALYGLLAAFETPDAVLDATQRARAAGYRRMDAYTPFPVEGLAEALDFHERRVPTFILACGIFGGAVGFFLQWYSATIDYPLNVGGRPFNSWPAFIPITFELTILAAACAALIGMLLLNGLPQPYHPVFNAPGFVRASQDRFFLCLQADDSRFDREETERFLRGLHPLEVVEVVDVAG